MVKFRRSIKLVEALGIRIASLGFDINSLIRTSWKIGAATGSIRAVCDAGEAWPFGTIFVGRSAALWRWF
jgi:hypothetical protein